METKPSLVAIGADDKGPLLDTLIADLDRRGAQVERFGAIADGSTTWAQIGRAVGEAVASGRADFAGIVCRWTGTRISIAANKVPACAPRSAPMPRPPPAPANGTTPTSSRLSLRATAPAVGAEILDAFLATAVSDDPGDRAEISAIEPSAARTPRASR